MKNLEPSILDDVEMIRSCDPSNMYNSVFDFPEHMEAAVKIADAWKVTASDFPDPRNVVVIGMGGSAIGGDLVRTFLSSRLLIPFQIIRDYKLPEYVDDETLVIASSYSGNTEETLAALDDALGRKAMIATISTGGLMKDVSEINAIPMAELPTGLQPRAALGYSVVPILLFFERIGLVKGLKDEIKIAIARLRQRRDKYIEDSPVASNPAKHLADAIMGRIPIIYSGPQLMDVVALRWKAQFCENSKNLAFANQCPELGHNELVGWTSYVVEPWADKLIVVMLRDNGDHPRVRKQMNIIKQLVEVCEIPVMEVHSMGESPLERMFSLIQLGDYVSYYLAVLNEADPTPVELIQALKQAMKEQ